MAAILVFFCFHANWPSWPRSKLNILLNFTFGKKKVLVTVGVAFYLKLFRHLHASYMEYSKVQTLKAHKSYKIVLIYANVIV